MRLHTLRLIFMFMFYQVIIYGQQVKMSYQAVFRDGSGLLLEEKTVQVEISILDGNGQVKYAEAHQIKTNAQGLGTLRIGEGTAQSGKLEGIEWGKGQFTMRTRLPEFNLESSSPILSVPYAVNSGIADSLRGGIADSLRNFKFKPIADGKQKGELLSWDGKQWLPLKSGKPGEVLSIGEDGTTSWSSLKIGRDTICPDSLTDIDGNRYGTVKVGKQCWMREDLRVTRFNDGTPIPFLTGDQTFEDFEEDLFLPVFKKYSVGFPHGNLYSLITIFHNGLCPPGWRIPNFKDLTTMLTSLASLGKNTFAFFTTSEPGGLAFLPYTDEELDLRSEYILASEGTTFKFDYNDSYFSLYGRYRGGGPVRCLRD